MYLLGINLDCWLFICRQLDLSDLIQLSKASLQFKVLVKYHVLPTRYKYATLNFKKQFLELEDFRLFLDAIHTTVVQVRLTEIPPVHYELLQFYCFPKVHQMHLSLERCMKDSDLSSLIKVFPSLELLKPHGNFTGRYMELFMNVSHLSLACCRNLNAVCLVTILTKMNLKSLELDVFSKKLPFLSEDQLTKLGKLEMISLNSYELQWLFQSKEPIALKNIKKLIVTDLSQICNVVNLFKYISQTIPHDVFELEIANNQYISKYIDPTEYAFLKAVQELKFLNVENILSMFDNPNTFHALRKLSFYYCNISQKSTFLAILTEAKQLKFLSFEECACPEFVITETQFKEALEGRTTPLTFNWYSKSLDIKRTEYGRFSSLLQLTHRLNISSNYNPMTIKFRKL